MKNNKALIFALTLVGAVNLFVLSGVVFNRSGEEAVLELTERELLLNKGDKEDTGMLLRLDETYESIPFDEMRLRTLGFDVDRVLRAQNKSKDYDYHHFPQKRMFAVLEHEGPAWKEWLRELDKQTEELNEKKRKGKMDNKDFRDELKSLQFRRESHSRLFLVDVGKDPAILRKNHPDSRRCAVVPALVGANVSKNKNDKGEWKTEFNGNVSVMNSGIHLEKEKRPFFQDLKPSDKSEYDWNAKKENQKREHWNPRYKVMLNFGKRFEPWVGQCGMLPIPVMTSNSK